jgi:nucleotide-binding universal stress UspA family protein
MYEKIMACIDGSDTADKVIDESVRLSLLAGARLHVVHVIDLPYLLTTVGFYDLVMLTHALRRQGTILLDRAQQRANAAHVPCTTELAETERIAETIAARLLHCADACGADLLTIGTHGHRGIDALLPGSVATRLCRIATCPVLLVPSATTDWTSGTKLL